MKVFNHEISVISYLLKSQKKFKMIIINDVENIKYDFIFWPKGYLVPHRESKQSEIQKFIYIGIYISNTSNTIT